MLRINDKENMTLEIFAEYLERKRKDLGYKNQAGFAKLCGISQPTLSRIEKGKLVSEGTYNRIAETLNTKITLILIFEPENSKK